MAPQSDGSPLKGKTPAESDTELVPLRSARGLRARTSTESPQAGKSSKSKPKTKDKINKARVMRVRAFIKRVERARNTQEREDQTVGNARIQSKDTPTRSPKWRRLTAADVQITPPDDPELQAALDWAEANWRSLVNR